MKKKKAASSKVTSKGLIIQDLEQVLELMGRHQVAELEYETPGNRLHLRTQASFTQSAPMSWASAPAPTANYAPAPQVHSQQSGATPAAPAAAPAAASKGKQVLSPFVGTFYRSASPGGEPYAKEGQVVKVGDALCIVEAMKLMNEIEAEFGGRIIQVLVENGQPVEFGEPLFVVEPA